MASSVRQAQHEIQESNEKLDEAVSDLKVKLQSVAGRARGTIRALKHPKDLIKSNPMSLIVAASLAGLLIGYLLRKRSKASEATLEYYS